MTQTKNSLPLQTERLRLRELEASDFDAVHAYTSDPFVVRFMPWGSNSETDTRDFLLRAGSLADAQPRLGYGGIEDAGQPLVDDMEDEVASFLDSYLLALETRDVALI